MAGGVLNFSLKRIHPWTTVLDTERMEWNYGVQSKLSDGEAMDRRTDYNSHPLSGFNGGEEPSPEEEIQELARLIHSEAGGLTKDTKAKVGWTVRNRVNERGYPDTYIGVIHEKKNGTKQYDAVGGERWNEAADLDKLNPKEYNDFRLSHEVAKGVYGGKIPDSSGAEFFISVDPKKATGFFKKAIADGSIRQIGPGQEGMYFFKDNTR